MAVINSYPNNEAANDDDKFLTLNNDGTAVLTSVQQMRSVAVSDNSLTTPKYANKSVTSAKLNLSKTTDANGWTVYDYGSWKEYELKTAVTAATKNQYEAWDTHSITLPIGVTVPQVSHIDLTPIYGDWNESTPATVRFVGQVLAIRVAALTGGSAKNYQHQFYVRIKV